MEGKLSEGEGSARLVVKEATRRHTGLYYCHAHNSLGTAQPVATAIIVYREYCAIIILKVTKIEFVFK